MDLHPHKPNNQLSPRTAAEGLLGARASSAAVRGDFF